MANTKISELTALGTTPADDDVLAIVDTSASTTKKVTVSNLVSAASGFDPNVDNPAIGNGASAGTNGVAVGHDATAGTLSVAIGNNVDSGVYGNVSVGNGITYATGVYNSIALGTSASMGQNCDSTILIGSSATSGFGDDHSVAIGSSSSVGHERCVALGNSSSADGRRSTALGYNAESGGTDSIAIGNASTNNGDNAIAIGENATANYDNAIHINTSGASTNVPTGAGHMVIETDDAKLEYDGDWTLNGGKLLSGQIEKQYRYDGALAVNTGDARLYIPVACSATDINLYLKTASSSGSVGVDFLIDGTVDTSMTIAQGSTSGSGSSTTAISAGSYITFDITSAGTGAEDLYAAISLTRS